MTDMLTALIDGPFERRDDGAFDGDTLRQEQERAHVLAELVHHPGWAVLVGELELAAAPYERRIAIGACKDHADYIAACLYVKGLREAITTPEVFNERLAKRLASSAPEQEETENG